jgi:5-bromo-4-chloroindolyl phosphate hydrolysis protein
MMETATHEDIRAEQVKTRAFIKGASLVLAIAFTAITVAASIWATSVYGSVTKNSEKIEKLNRSVTENTIAKAVSSQQFKQIEQQLQELSKKMDKLGDRLIKKE